MRSMLCMLALSACSSEPEGPTVEEQAAQKCPRVHMDKLAGDWVSIKGDPKVRFRVVERDGEVLLWFVDPMFSNHRLELVGQKRASDWRFDERPRGMRKALIAKGGEAPKRVYLAPKLKKCAVEAYAGIVAPGDKEIMPAKPASFVMFPERADAVFAYAPFDEPVFLGEAAEKKSVADAERASEAGPTLEARMGAVTVAAYADVEADGDPSCTYTFDAYFDDRPVDGAQGVAAQEPEDGVRAYRYTFDAPYSGNHRLELHRKRTCGDEVVSIAIAGVDAVLQ